MSVFIEGLERHHNRANFDCGEPALNDFLQRLARQQGGRDFSRTYVAVDREENRIRGFYAISAASIDFANLPAGLTLPRYPVPVARMGRLAVDLRDQGAGVGASLLTHAMKLAANLAGQIGLYALVVDAKHEAVAAYYQRYGFARFANVELSLFLTTDVIRKGLVTLAASQLR